MFKQISIKNRLLFLALISIVFLSIAIVVYYFQNENSKISADVASSDQWTSENVGDCYFLDTKTFNVNPNNVLNLVCRDVNVSATDSSSVSITADYLTRNSSGWLRKEVPLVSPASNTQRFAPIVDQEGNLHILTQDYQATSIKHYFYDGKNWTNEDIPIGESESLVNRSNNQMQVNSKNELYALLYNSKTRKYSILYEDNGSWKTKNILDNVEASSAARMTVDHSDNIDIADYYLNTGNQFSSEAFAIYSAADNWKPQVFDYNDFKLATNSTDVDMGSLLMIGNPLVDSNNHMHILVSKQTKKNGAWHQDYYYLTNKDGSWKNELVLDDAIYDTDRGVSMALDMSGNPHIAYVQNSGMKYKYFNGSSWKTETENIDNMTKNSDIQLVIDKNNISHIIYDKNYSVKPLYHITKQIAPYKVFNPNAGSDSSSNSTNQNNSSNNTANSTVGNQSSSSNTTGSPSTNIPSSSSSSQSDISNISQLVSTGASLWFNILIAMAIIASVGYFMFRDEIFNQK